MKEELITFDTAKLAKEKEDRLKRKEAKEKAEYERFKTKFKN